MEEIYMEKEKLIDILVDERIHNALENALEENAEFQSAQSEHDKACAELNEAGLSKEQSQITDKAISTANECGAAYGAVAYRQGFNDGIKLAAELKEDFLKIAEKRAI